MRWDGARGDNKNFSRGDSVEEGLPVVLILLVAAWCTSMLVGTEPRTPSAQPNYLEESRTVCVCVCV